MAPRYTIYQDESLRRKILRALVPKGDKFHLFSENLELEINETRTPFAIWQHDVKDILRRAINEIYKKNMHEIWEEKRRINAGLDPPVDDSGDEDNQEEHPASGPRVVQSVKELPIPEGDDNGAVDEEPATLLDEEQHQLGAVANAAPDVALQEDLFAGLECNGPGAPVDEQEHLPEDQMLFPVETAETEINDVIHTDAFLEDYVAPATGSNAPLQL